MNNNFEYLVFEKHKGQLHQMKTKRGLFNFLKQYDFSNVSNYTSFIDNKLLVYKGTAGATIQLVPVEETKELITKANTL